jgi:hypothetical protein
VPAPSDSEREAADADADGGRNPLLMATHYAVAIIVALFCGFFFYHVTNDIPGFQNRLGLFLFILSLFGFSCLSSLGIFANERMLFMRER